MCLHRCTVKITFWIQACFALAAAFYNTGQAGRGNKYAGKSEFIGGRRRTGCALSGGSETAEPPEKMRYLFAPTAEQADILFNRLQSLLEEPSDTSEYALRWKAI